jgi:hypothetical protein
LYNLVDRRHTHVSTAVTINQSRCAPSSEKFDGAPSSGYWGASTTGAGPLDQRARWLRGEISCAAERAAVGPRFTWHRKRLRSGRRFRWISGRR